jgi:hypothetical protein
MLRMISPLDDVRPVAWTSELTYHILHSIPLRCLLAIFHTLLWLKGELPRKCPMPACLLTVKLQIYLYLIHFFRNNCNLLVELKYGLFVDRLYKRNCGKPTGIEQTSIETQKGRERKRVFFLSLCHKTRPL